MDNLKYFVLILYMCYLIQCKPMCDFTDEKCMTNASNKMFKTLVKGIKGEGTSDPLHENKIEGELLNLKYIINNVTITGMLECKVTHLVCYPEKSWCEFFLQCPQLVSTFEYELKGPVGILQIDGKGTGRITTDDYAIFYKGEYGTFIDKTDQTPRIFVKTFTIETITKGTVTTDIKNLVKGDIEKSTAANNYISQNWRVLEGMYQPPFTHVLLKNFLYNYSEVLQSHHLEDLFSKDD